MFSVKTQSTKKKRQSPDLAKKFEESLMSGGLIRSKEKIWVACSGGPDSIALLYLLADLQASWRLSLGVLHFDHGLRGKASHVDQSFVRRTARLLKLPYRSARAVNLKKQARLKKQSLEEAAREARYVFFIREAKKARIQKIALGHTRDDQAETVLMRLIRGTGPRGLSGIRKKLMLEKVTFVRPLLGFTKADILEWLRNSKIKYRQDASNETDTYERNKIRRHFLPWLRREIHPRVTETLARLADVVEEENEFMTALCDTAWKKMRLMRRRGQITLNRKEFSSFHSAVQFRLLDRLLKKVHPQSGLDFETWQSVKKALKRPTDRRSLARGLDFRLTPSKIVVCRHSSVH